MHDACESLRAARETSTRIATQAFGAGEQHGSDMVIGMRSKSLHNASSSLFKPLLEAVGIKQDSEEFASALSELCACNGAEYLLQDDFVRWYILHAEQVAKDGFPVWVQAVAQTAWRMTVGSQELLNQEIHAQHLCHILNIAYGPDFPQAITLNQFVMWYYTNLQHRWRRRRLS
jgi:hypothetical protein